jgi:hypothetical protein
VGRFGASAAERAATSLVTAASAPRIVSLPNVRRFKIKSAPGGPSRPDLGPHEARSKPNLFGRNTLSMAPALASRAPGVEGLPAGRRPAGRGGFVSSSRGSAASGLRSRGSTHDRRPAADPRGVRPWTSWAGGSKCSGDGLPVGDIPISNRVFLLRKLAWIRNSRTKRCVHRR